METNNQLGAAPQAGFLRRNLLRVVGFGLGLPLMVFGAYTWVSLTYNYSEGDRVGYLQKLSRRGWICTTWEGELAISTVPGVAPERFEFSVRDDAVAAQLNVLQGRRVALYYEQKKGVPSSCFGDTEYFVTKARDLDKR